MTNSYASSRKHPKLILIHGMNNNQECFFPLRDALKERGFEVEMIVLPNHGEKREEVRTLDEALKLFDESLSPLIKEPYVVVAFSQGAQYFQLWMMDFKKKLPEEYVLLAPAVFINFFGVISRIFELLPPKFFILSQMPRMFRRYDKLFFWEYNLLMQGVKRFAEKTLPMPPSLVVIDPKDELVNGKKVIKHYRELGSGVVELKRKSLRKTLGKHHIIFHPDYFQAEEWNDFIQNISIKLSAEA